MLSEGQMMRVKQFELFREDIRDLMNLTVGKMDNYLIVAWWWKNSEARFGAELIWHLRHFATCFIKLTSDGSVRVWDFQASLQSKNPTPSERATGAVINILVIWYIKDTTHFIRIATSHCKGTDEETCI